MSGFFPFWWCGPGSNRRHKDFQSFALPTELPHHFYSVLNCFIVERSAKVNVNFFLPNFYLSFF